MLKNISNLGDAALYCDFGKEVNRKINSQVIRYFKTIQKKNIVLLYYLSLYSPQFQNHNIKLRHQDLIYFLSCHVILTNNEYGN